MAGSTSPIFEAVPNVKGTQFTSTDTTAKKTVFTAGANGSRIDGIVVSSDDTSAVNLRFYINDGTTDYYIGVVAITIGAGYTSVPRVNALTTINVPAIACLVLPSGYTLKAACMATMTAAKTMDVVCLGGDF